MENPAQGGAPDRRTGRLDTPEFTRKTHNPQAAARAISAEVAYQPCSDECVFRLSRALRMGRIEGDSWAFNFTRSILRHSKRRSWIPTPKQLHTMRRLLAELTEPDTGPLIDDGGGDDWAA